MAFSAADVFSLEMGGRLLNSRFMSAAVNFGGGPGFACRPAPIDRVGDTGMLV
jgi:hypothetical protein